MKNRWKCPACGSDHVQIALPAWFIETEDCELTHVDTDAEANILWWHCPLCSETGSGAPEEN